jgi:hypothetical protein
MAFLIVIYGTKNNAVQKAINIQEQDHAPARYPDSPPTYPVQSDRIVMLLMSSLSHWLIPKPTHLPTCHQY